MSAVPDRPLLRLARAETHRAKQLRTYRVAAHAVTLLIGTGGLALSGRGTYLVSLAAVLSEAVAWIYRQESRDHHRRGEQGLRTAELRRNYDPSAGAGTDPEFRSAVSRWACKHANESRFDDSRYWNSAAGIGREPFRISLQEAAFFSYRLYAKAASYALIAATVMGVAVAASVLLFVLADLDQAAEVTGRLTLLLVAAVISADLITVRRDWTSAAQESRAVYNALSSQARTDADLFRTWGDYRTVTAATEPIPDWIYRREEDRINTALQADLPASS